MSLKLYYDLLSQPCRAVVIFLKVNNIPFEECRVELVKGQQLTEDFAKVNPIKKAPAIDEDGFKLSESITIMKYLAQKHAVPSHWYPSDLRKRARVDEYLDWHQGNTRPNAMYLFQQQMLIPMLRGVEIDQAKVEHYRSELIKTLDSIENVFLKDQQFLAGDEISIADIAAACELTQPGMANFDLFSQRPTLNAWMERVRSQTNPHFDDAHEIIRKVREERSSKFPIVGDNKL